MISNIRQWDVPLNGSDHVALFCDMLYNNEGRSPKLIQK